MLSLETIIIVLMPTVYDVKLIELPEFHHFHYDERVINVYNSIEHDLYIK